MLLIFGTFDIVKNFACLAIFDIIDNLKKWAFVNITVISDNCEPQVIVLAGLKKIWGSTGIWTRDLLHPKQES